MEKERRVRKKRFHLGKKTVLTRTYFFQLGKNTFQHEKLFSTGGVKYDLCCVNERSDMPSKEYYRKLKKEAHDLYVREGMTCKEISTRINVSERSVSSWINENDALWKKERQASVISSQKQGDNLKQIINILADQKLELLRMIDEAITEGDSDKVLELRKQAATLDNSVAQWGNQLKEVDKKNRITLAIYIDVMSRIFDAMKVYNADLYFKTLDFQENHLYEAAKMLG